MTDIKESIEAEESELFYWPVFKENVEQWAIDRGIYEHSNSRAQLFKALSEIGELADGIIKDRLEEIKDAIGDVAVCLVNYSVLIGIDIKDIQCSNEENFTQEIGDLVGQLIGYLSDLLTYNHGAADLIEIVRRMFLDLVLISQMHNLSFIDCCESA